jgi:tetratricopeptide (TPR) repeat protein
MDALATLDAIGAENTLPPGEALFLRGSAYFGLGDYATARLHLAQAQPLVATSADPGAADILPILLFQLGASRYLIGEDGPAVESLAAFIALDPDAPFAAGGYQLLLQALVAQGERSRAEKILAEAQSRFAGTAHEKEFAALPPAP